MSDPQAQSLALMSASVATKSVDVSGVATSTTDPPGREHLSRSEPRPKTWIPAISTLSVCDLGADSTCWPMQLWPKPDAVVKWGRMEPGVAMAVGDA